METTAPDSEHMTRTVRCTTALREALRPDLGAAVFAVIVTACTLASGLFGVGSDVMGLAPAEVLSWVDLRIAAVLTVASIVFAAVVYVVAGLILRGLHLLAQRCRQRAPIPFREQLRTSWLRYACVLFVCWLPWLIAFFPGSLDQDTIWQLYIWRTPAAWTDHHPWLTTMVFGWFADMGSAIGNQGIGVFVYCLIQCAAIAAATAALLCEVRRFDVPVWLFRTLFTVACTVPVFGGFATEMVKDSLFVPFWIGFVILFIEGIRTRGACLRTPLRLLLFALMGLGMASTRKTGIYLFALAVIFLVIYCSPKLRARLVAAALVPCAVMTLWSGVVLPSWGIGGSESYELLSIPFQQTARYVSVHPDEVTDAERAAIDKVLPYDTLTAIYDPGLSDPVKYSYRNDGTDKLTDYLAVWAQMGFKHPETYTAAVFNTSFNLFCPAVACELKQDTTDETMWEYIDFFSDGVAAAARENGDTASTEQVAAAGHIDDLIYPAALDVPRAAMLKYEWVFNHTPTRLLNAPATATFFVPLLITCYLLSRRSRSSRAGIAWALIPSWLLIATVIAGPIAFSRYCMPAAYIAPLVVVLPGIMALQRQHDDVLE